jgi:hypothetical protein
MVSYGLMAVVLSLWAGNAGLCGNRAGFSFPTVVGDITLLHDGEKG